MPQAPTHCAALIAPSGSGTTYTELLGEKITLSRRTVVLRRDRGAITPKSELSKAKVQLAGRIFTADGFGFKFKSFQPGSCSLLLKIPTFVMNIKHMRQTANNEVPPTRCNRLESNVHPAGSAPSPAFQGSGSESASLVRLCQLLSGKNCLSLGGRGIRTWCSSFQAKENVNNLELAAF